MTTCRPMRLPRPVPGDSGEGDAALLGLHPQQQHVVGAVAGEPGRHAQHRQPRLGRRQLGHGVVELLGQRLDLGRPLLRGLAALRTSGLGGLLGHDVAPSAVRCAASGACPVSPLGGPSVRPRGSACKGGSKGSSAQRTRRAKMLCGPCMWRGAGRTLGRPRERAAGVDQQFLGPRGPERRANVTWSWRPAVLLDAGNSSVARVTLSRMEVTESLLAGVPVGKPPRAAGRVRRGVGRGGAAQPRAGRTRRSGLVPGWRRGDVPVAGRGGG